MEWTKGSFEISANRGIFVRDGVISPPFGVHRQGEGCWRITHLPSGFAFSHHFLTIDDATKAADAARIVLNCWDDPFINGDCEIWADQAKRVRDAIDSSGALYVRSQRKIPHLVPSRAMNGYEAI